MKIFTFLLIIATAQSTWAAWAGVQVEEFWIEYLGGGQLKAVVAKSNSSLQVTTMSCHYKPLSPEQQARTAFTLTGADLEDAQAIFNTKATLASEEDILGPTWAGGSFLQISVIYSFDTDDFVDGEGPAWDKREIMNPLVLINGHTSEVIRNIGKQAETASAAVCAE